MKINSTEVKHLDPIECISVSHIGEYQGIGAAFEKLAAWAEENHLWAASPRIAAIYHDDPMKTPAGELRSNACIENLSGLAPTEGMKAYTITGGRYFVMQVEVSMTEYVEAWQMAYATVKRLGHECDVRDHYELYLTTCDMQDPASTSVVELCIPIK